MSARPIGAVVPVKPFAAAKRRLAPLLTRDQRAELARLMLEDVLAALAACAALSGIVVVTRDDTAGHIARARGVVVLDDAGGDINAAVQLGSALLTQRGDDGMIVVPADIPLLPASLVEELAARISRPPAVALVPALHDGGTNLLACSPVDAISPSFGPDSFARHCGAARHAGVVPTVLASERAGLDIDRPEDLAAFLALGSATRTHAFLARLAIEAGGPSHAGLRVSRQIVKA